MTKSILRTTFVLFSFAVLFTACVPALEGLFVSPGDPIRFSATSSDGEAGTRTSYSGFKGQVDGITVERINWEPNDPIRITAAQSPERFADYKVTDISTVDSDIHSSAQIIPASSDGRGLSWGTGSHDFYAIYPAPGFTGVSSALDYEGGSTVNLPIPRDQTSSDVVTETTTGPESISRKIMRPNMKYAYMCAAKQVANPTGSVSLDFKPVFSAFEITVGSDGNDELDLYDFTMTATQLLSGTYQVNMNAGQETWALVANSVTGSNSIFVNLGGENHPTTLTASSTLTFTVFAIPQSPISGIELHFSTSKGPRTLKLKDSNDVWLQVTPGQKAVIYGLQIPGVLRYYTIDPIDNQVFWGVGASFSSFTVSSYSYSIYDPDAQTKYPERWKIMYSSDYNATTGTGSWHNTPNGDDEDPEDPEGAGISWLSASASTVDGVEKLTLNLEARTEPSSTEIGEIDVIHKAILAANPVATNYDLSMHTIHGDTRDLPVTANCYVVKAPGSYLFPIVYGNAIDGTKSDASTWAEGSPKVVNVEAYKPSSENIPANAQYFLKHFFNANNVPIETPFIEADLGITSTTPLDVISLWQDGTTEPIMTGTPTIEAGPSSNPLYGKCRFIRFEIPQASIRQGNIVIALRDVSAGDTPALAKIIWSWMIDR